MNKIYLFAVVLIFMAGCKSSILDDPSTKISYSIPEKAHVKVTVENSYNTVIATLVDGELQAGNYEIEFNEENLAEGIYFYTLEAKGIGNSSYYKLTKHMLLVKQ